jgi:hypothetical protein
MIAVFSGIQIILSPLLLGSIAGAIIYFSHPTDTRLVLAIALALIGLMIGIFWASRVWKREGTSRYVSRISASPDLDPDPGKLKD